MSKYDEDLKKACEILNNTELDELVQVAVEAMDDAATDIGMEASQEWHAKITLESALIHIAEKVAKRPQLTIPKRIVDIINGYCKHNFTADRLIMMAYRDYQEFNDWIIKDWVKNDNIARAYLAGKALGVDLAKVVEG
ncbi:hypothetical protein KGN15_002315 [Lactococcus lactis]|uniref:hypothetical protein n=1 Tax=Lactococcus lactis TaxID=1358 RepID=UPI0020A78113|nr:hypothetical protein [Lactococcus lactis]